MKKGIMIGIVVCIISAVAAGFAVFSHSRKGWC